MRVSEWLCNRSLLFQIKLLYSDAGGEWFQAADNGPTESILTFSLVIAEFAGEVRDRTFVLASQH